MDNVTGSASSSPSPGGNPVGATSAAKTNSSQEQQVRRIIVAMDLLRRELVKTNQAVIENAKAYLAQTRASSAPPTPGSAQAAAAAAASPAPGPPGSDANSVGNRLLQLILEALKNGQIGNRQQRRAAKSQSKYPIPDDEPDPLTEEKVRAAQNKSAYRKRVQEGESLGDFDESQNYRQNEENKAAYKRRKKAGQPLYDYMDDVDYKSDMFNEHATKEQHGFDKAARNRKLPVAKKAGDDPLTAAGIRAQQRAEREKANQGAYQRRVQAGQGLGDYDEKQNYSRRRNDPRYGRDQNRQFNDSAQARAPRGAGGGGAGTAATRTATAALSAFTGMILRAIGPIGIVIGMLTAVSSGFAQFQAVVDLLVTVLGSALLPFFLLFGAAVLSLTQIFMDRMAPAMEEFFSIILQLVPIFEALLKVVTVVYDMYMNMIVAIREFINFLGGVILQKLKDGAEKVLPGSDEILRNAREQAENFINEGKKRIGEKKGDDVGDFRKAFGMMLQSFKLSVGPKATLTALDTSWNKKLLDAINVDPIEAEKKRMLMKIIELLERALAKADAQKAEAPVKGGDGNAQARRPMAANPQGQGIS